MRVRAASASRRTRSTSMVLSLARRSASAFDCISNRARAACSTCSTSFARSAVRVCSRTRPAFASRSSRSRCFRRTSSSFAAASSARLRASASCRLTSALRAVSASSARSFASPSARWSSSSSVRASASRPARGAPRRPRIRSHTSDRSLDRARRPPHRLDGRDEGRAGALALTNLLLQPRRRCWRCCVRHA